jgi:hypothetical protein
MTDSDNPLTYQFFVDDGYRVPLCSRQYYNTIFSTLPAPGLIPGRTRISVDVVDVYGAKSVGTYQVQMLANNLTFS